MSERQLVLGIDGGGTKTVAWLAHATPHAEPEVIGRGGSGPANPRAAGFEAAFANLRTAINAAFHDSGRRPSKTDALCIALAGADRAAEREQLGQWADEQRLTRQLVLVNDAEPILACGTPSGWGIALIGGTGSLAYGRTAQGQTSRVGGWGYVFGDEGSGFALGVAGLRAAARDADGRGPPTTLLNRLLQHLHIERASQLVEVIYGEGVDRPLIAELGRLVLDADAEGDPVAQAIIDAAAADLAEMVRTLARQLSFEGHSPPLALAGSLLVRTARIRDAVADRLIREEAVSTIQQVDSPVRGAVQLAQQALESTP